MTQTIRDFIVVVGIIADLYLILLLISTFKNF